MKVTIELNLDNEADCKALDLLRNQNKPMQPADPAPVVRPVSPQQHPMVEVRKEMGVVAKHLGEQIGSPPGKMSNKDRASLAAKTRWANYHARKAGLPIPPKRPKKKIIKRIQHDFTKAEEQTIESFPSENAQNYVLGTLDKRQGFPDGREIIDGTWRFAQSNEAVEAETTEEPILEEDYVKEVHEIAKKFGDNDG